MKRYWRIVLPILILVSGLALMAGCSEPMTISEATMCLGLDTAMRPVNPTSSFKAGVSNINVSLKVANAPRNTEVRAEMFYVKGSASSTSRLVSAARAIVEGTAYVGLTFTRGSIGAWPLGEYRVDVYAKGDKILDVPFTTTN